MAMNLINMNFSKEKNLFRNVVKMYDIYNELNKVTDYIEEHILDQITTKELASLIGLNENVLKNVFDCLTGISITEYIRLRRLSCSVTDILNGESITSVSYKYLYNSPSSYNRAFKKFEGLTPRDLKKNNKELKLFNKIQFKESIKNYNINYKIYKNKELNLYSVSKKIDYSNRTNEIPDFWEEVKLKYPEFINNKRYGFLDKNSKELAYYCMLEKKFNHSKKIRIKKCNYFAIKTTSFEASDIIDNINKGLREYIYSLNYKLVDMPRIEIYNNNYVEILIPIT